MENLEYNNNRTPCEVWSRVMGYYRPVSHYNIGKQAEFYTRTPFQETVIFNNNLTSKYK